MPSIIKPILWLCALFFSSLVGAWAQNSHSLHSSRSLQKSRTSRTPRLLVNIMLSNVEKGALERYSSNFSVGGFRKLLDEGLVFSGAEYNFQLSSPQASLASQATGTTPSMHGFVGKSSFNYPANEILPLAFEDGELSREQIIVETLSDKLLSENNKSRSISIAFCGASALAMAGKAGDCLWFDENKLTWQASFAVDSLSAWLESQNRRRLPVEEWKPFLEEEGRYINEISRSLIYKRQSAQTIIEHSRARRERWEQMSESERLRLTPSGNDLILSMALRAANAEGLGLDGEVDILNIYLDPLGDIVDHFGARSVETEDAILRLDDALERFLMQLSKQVLPEDLLLVLSSTKGACLEEQQMRFNSNQYASLVESFLRAKYGEGDWVIGFQNGAIYLNHNTIYEHKLSLETIQDEVASFSLQFRGVNHALSSNDLRSSSSSQGYMAFMQRAFSPRRSGDVLLNLMPNWVFECEDLCANQASNDKLKPLSGSLYRYDREVPLIIWGFDFLSSPRATSLKLSPQELTLSLAQMMGIGAPSACEGEPLMRYYDGHFELK